MTVSTPWRRFATSRKSSSSLRSKPVSSYKFKRNLKKGYSQQLQINPPILHPNSNDLLLYIIHYTISQSLLLLLLILLPPQLLRLVLPFHQQSKQLLVEYFDDLPHDWALSDCIEQSNAGEDHEEEDVEDGVVFIAEPDVVVDEVEDEQQEVGRDLLHMRLVSFTHN
jgi:hypothetical protein